MKKFYYQTYSPVFQTVQDVITHMELLQIELEGTDLENIRAFNKTYLIITQNVFKKIGTGFFKHDDIMTVVDINFAQYFFNALKNYTSGKNPPSAWKILFDSSKSNNLYQFIYMALGVNAHVNNDLAFTLHDVVRNDSYQIDFNKVNTIIHQSLKEVIESLNEPSQLITLAEKSLLPLYTIFLDSLIKNWRNRTWINYKNLRDKKMNSDMVENVAENIAEKLVKIKNISDFYKLSGVYLNDDLYATK